MTLPIALSVPHAGLQVPPEVRPWCALTDREVLEDGDVGAARVYDLSREVAAFATTTVARAIVDLNRPEDDRSRDGIIKTHTCWNVPVYREPLPDAVVEQLLAAHYRPYHRRLTGFSGHADIRIAVDCHTMAAQGPPVGPDPGRTRPWICLSNAGGTCPTPWIEELARAFRRLLDGEVRINDPFRGGHITRRHAAEMPWLQMEMSREPFLEDEEKREVVIEAFERWLEGDWDEGAAPPRLS